MKKLLNGGVKRQTDSAKHMPAARQISIGLQGAFPKAPRYANASSMTDEIAGFLTKEAQRVAGRLRYRTLFPFVQRHLQLPKRCPHELITSPFQLVFE